ncbi:hypothetical protein BWX38_10040 [Acidipropionibacterium acidipropionici]|nr:hypothetical protein BWX38_10040 [Acidipropionibacterium acidipropionici]
MRQLCEFAADRRVRTRKERPRVVESAIQVVGLTDVADRKVMRLSGGMRQRLGIAISIIGDPAMIVMDEPTVSLDIDQRRDFRELATQLAYRMPVVVSTHLVDDVESMSGRMVLLSHGDVAFDGSTTTFHDHSSVNATNPWESAY